MRDGARCGVSFALAFVAAPASAVVVDDNPLGSIEKSETGTLEFTDCVTQDAATPTGTPVCLDVQTVSVAVKYLLYPA